MKKNLLLAFASIIFMNNSYAQNVPNGGFENWTAGDPNGWFTYNQVTPTVTQTTPANSGNWAAKGQPGVFSGQIFPPVLISTNASGTGFPVTQDYGTFSFFYKLNLATVNDVFDATIVMNDAAGIPIAAGGVQLASNTSSFTQATIPITYTSAGAATCIITFAITDLPGAGSPDPNSYYIVDDVALSGTTGTLENTNYAYKISAQPNPFATQTTLHMHKNVSDATIKIYNTVGQKVKQVNNLQGNSVDLQRDNLPCGLYFIYLTHGNVVIGTEKLHIQD